MYPAPLKLLLEALERLPGVGARTAERFAFHLLQDRKETALQLAEAIRQVKEDLRPCSRCGMVTSDTLCGVCGDPARDHGLILVVEQPKDLYAIERLHQYRGVYHVLMGSLALLDGVQEKNLNLDGLNARLAKGDVREVILATNPNLEGDTTALHLLELLKRHKVSVSRFARGLSSGSPLAYASRAVLEDALEDRRRVL